MSTFLAIVGFVCFAVCVLLIVWLEESRVS